MEIPPGKVSDKGTNSHRLLLFVVAFLTLWQPALGQDVEAQKRAADQILRLPPGAFPELPTNVVQDLHKRGCTVPQSSLNPKPQNVLHGEFAQRGQNDWVILCSKNKSTSSLGWDVRPPGIPREATVWTSTILVYFGGSTANVAEIDEALDFYEMLGIDRFVNGWPVITGYNYSRILRSADKSYIEEHIRAYGEPDVKYPPIDHEGIEDPILDKASRIHYFYQGKWLVLPGAD